MKKSFWRKAAYVLSAILLIVALVGVYFTGSALIPVWQHAQHDADSCGCMLVGLNVLVALIACIFVAAATVIGGALALLSKGVWPGNILLLVLHSVALFLSVAITVATYFLNK